VWNIRKDCWWRKDGKGMFRKAAKGLPGFYRDFRADARRIAHAEYEWAHEMRD